MSKEHTEEQVKNNNERPNQKADEKIFDENKGGKPNSIEAGKGEDHKAEHEKVDYAQQIADLKDKYLRLAAEFDNYRKRVLKEKSELILSGGEKVIVSILPVIDDFERALDNIDKAKDLQSAKSGIDLIYHKLIKSLEANGLKEIEATGKDFDTDVHEAVAMIPAPSDEQKGKVVDCVQKGYKLNDKVIRHAKVAVGQ